MSILIENISKDFGRLSQINLEIPTGSLVALIGPSGSGKSTLLRTLAGFETPDSGRIWFQGQNSTHLSIAQREIGFVFQDYALFPKLNVYENIAFGLKIKKNKIKSASARSLRGASPSKRRVRQREPWGLRPGWPDCWAEGWSDSVQGGCLPLSSSPLPFGASLRSVLFSPFGREEGNGELVALAPQVDQLLHLTQLENFATYFPHELSGGQKQRVGFARALAIEPQILLLDEPFGALDIQVRKSLRLWLRNLHEKLPMTSILVTHDLEEAMEIADEIIIFKQGRVEQIGTAEEIYDYPATQFVQTFISA
uniref:Sulfate ABC transporter ATP-binding subunit n=1 Tax=Caulerpa cliftonii TaxID=1004391 RepID=A0A1C9JBR4_9CHLO|nr:sulfate ABC transporter ATP-binding subunit [Caulerpa cliftonii]AOP19286.1 sulfate ABC transporter ATP-binding subunit [Caulerpa cliftonii]